MQTAIKTNSILSVHCVWKSVQDCSSQNINLGLRMILRQVLKPKYKPSVLTIKNESETYFNNIVICTYLIYDNSGWICAILDVILFSETNAMICLEILSQKMWPQIDRYRTIIWYFYSETNLNLRILTCNLVDNKCNYCRILSSLSRRVSCGVHLKLYYTFWLVSIIIKYLRMCSEN